MRLSSSLRAVIAGAAVFIQLPGVLAFQFMRSDTLPSENLSGDCATALTVDISSCPRQVSSFSTGSYFDADALEEACTSECATALSRYNSDAGSACGPDDVYSVSETHEAPVSFIPTLLYYYFNKTCIEDEGRWCNNVAFDLSNGTANASPSSRTNMSTIIRRQQSVDICDDCVIKAYQFQAGSPINGGYALQSNYSSLTESCSKTGFPLASSSTLYPQPTITDTPVTCSGSTYTLTAGDTCRSISQSQGIGTAWLLSDNNLPAFCANFPTEGELCIQRTCRAYTVQANDTCSSISKNNGISQVQLYTWNPVLGTLCNSIAKSEGDSICVSPPGDTDFPTAPVPTTSAPTSTPTVAPVPTNIANGTTTNCAKYYSVETGEYWPINQYPGHPDYIPPESSIPDMPYDNLPKATFTPPAITGLPTNAPLAEGTRKDCFVFANGENLAVDMELFPSFSSACQVLAVGWGVTLEQIANWNPSLVTNSSDCAPAADYRYCMGAYDGASVSQTPAPTETPSQYPIREGATEDCVEFEAVIAPMTCESVLNRNHITIEQFYQWNPSVGADCANLWLGYRYCVSTDLVPTDVPSTTASATPTSTSSSPPISTSPVAPGPTQPGTVENCNAWHVVGDGDSCWAITEEYQITLDQFYAWNPAIQDDCNTNFWLDYAYCVGVSS
ncbi:hypothetical protein F4677DRAFT_441082 [Hypoxylon crocopeplum]|nr:hypothetical protein F4677DRAFT_441082 [Hypoxylon crocopeplum]